MSVSSPQVCPFPAQPTLHWKQPNSVTTLTHNNQLNRQSTSPTLQDTSPFLCMVHWALVSQGSKAKAAQDSLGRQPVVWFPKKPGLQPPHL